MKPALMHWSKPQRQIRALSDTALSKILASAAMSLAIASPSSASDRMTLISMIEAAANHEYADERRSARIKDCVMTTYRWREMPDHGWVLWTSFQFSMDSADIIENKRIPGQHYLYTLLKADPVEEGFVIIPFEMQNGVLARHERSILRTPSQATTPSPRGDGTSHYYEMRDNFFIHLQGPDVEGKAREFTGKYIQYVAEYCSFIS